MHVASLGEYEQGLPVLEKLKSEYPDYTFLLTFFSPSGYEVKKNSSITDLVYYLPLDTLKNANQFIQLAKPKLIQKSSNLKLKITKKIAQLVEL